MLIGQKFLSLLYQQNINVMIKIKEFTTTDNQKVTLVVTDSIAFWLFEEKAYPCNPTDASWLLQQEGWVYTSMYWKYSDHISNMLSLWQTAILPAIKRCDQNISTQKYWEMAQLPYWGVNILYQGVFITQYKGVCILNNAGFYSIKNDLEDDNKWYLGGESEKFKYDCYQNSNYFIEVL